MEDTRKLEMKEALRKHKEEHIKTLPVYKAEDLVEFEKRWSSRFSTYLFIYERDGKLEGRKYRGAFASGMLFDFHTGRCLAQRPHAIYEFSREFNELENKFSDMVMDIFDELSEEEKGDLVSF